MKRLLKYMCLIAIIAISALAFAACGAPSNMITADAAKQIAVTDLGTDIASANFSSISTDVKNGVTYYDVEFKLGGVKYEYRINSVTGDISKIEINDQAVSMTEKPVLPTTPSGAELYITLDEAKAAAFADAGVTVEDITIREAKIDYDDGMYLYEIEFKVTATGDNFEYEIKAAKADNGAIYKKEINDINVIEPNPADPNANYIGLDAAKAIVYANAEIAEADALLTKAKFEVDNGVHVYEIEFTVGNVEYEYEINAVSGTIVEKKVGGVSTLPTPPDGNYIGIDAAKSAALAHSGFSAEQVVFVEAKLDVEKGIYIYEIDFKSGGFEYEYEINATTGAIVSVDKDRD